jgi:hypothetical protein
MFLLINAFSGVAQNMAVKLSGVNSGIYSKGNTDLFRGSKVFTFSMWVKPGENQNKGAFLFDYEHTLNGNFFIRHDNSDNPGNFQLIFFGGSEWKTARAVSLKPNEWQHFAVVLGENYLYYYIDAVQVDSIGLPPAPAKTIKHIDARIAIGGVAALQKGTFKGYVDDIKVFNIEISKNEIDSVISNPNYRQEHITLKENFQTRNENYLYKGADFTALGAPTGEECIVNKTKKKQVLINDLYTNESTIMSDPTRDDFIYHYQYLDIAKQDLPSFISHVEPYISSVYVKGKTSYTYQVYTKYFNLDEYILLKRETGGSKWEVAYNSVYKHETNSILLKGLSTSTDFALGIINKSSKFVELSEPSNQSYYNIDHGVEFKWRSSTTKSKLSFGTDNPPTNILKNQVVEGKSYLCNASVDPQKQYYWQIETDFGKSSVYTFHPCLSDGDVVINELLVINSWSSHDPDYTLSSDWVEIRNNSNYAVDLSNYYLGDNKNKWKTPGDSILLPGKYQLYWADGKDYKNHTNFKLKDNSESVYLYHGNSIIDSVTYNNQYQDVSFGRDEKNSWKYFHNPTPNFKNSKGYNWGRTKIPIYSKDAGFYNEKFVLEIKGVEGSKIYYTLDGSEPTLSSSELSRAISVDKTTVIKCIAFLNKKLPSRVITNTYFIGERFSLPVISLSTDNDFLNGELGIFENTKEDWERVVNFEYFDRSGAKVLDQNIGVKLNGWGIRNYPMKPLSVFARAKYGNKTIDYPFFHDRETTSYSNLILRNGGNDITNTKIRDGLMHILVDEINIDNQAFQPAITFINGDYNGIMNIREKVNEQYLVSYHDVNPKKIDMLEPVLRGKSFTIVNGENALSDYENLERYILENDIKQKEVYEYVSSKIDIDEYINYQIAEIYFANLDWMGNNVKLWKEQKEGAKWRWILFDTDFGFGLFDYSDSDQNLLESASAANGTEWPNPPFSTFLFRKLLENESFEQEFSQRFVVYLYTIFEPQRVIHVIDSLENMYTPEMAKQVWRWGAVKTVDNWHNNVKKLREFAELRPSYCVEHLQDKFKYSGTTSISVSTNNGGNLIINGAVIGERNYSGEVFKNVPVAIIAEPKEGFSFSHWKNLGSYSENMANENKIQITFQEPGPTLEAVFIKR